MVAQWSALLPHSKKVLGLIPRWGRQGLSVWSLHVLPVFAWVSSGCSSFPHHHKNMYRLCVYVLYVWTPSKTRCNISRDLS
ncbi:hypothetical protein LDENG_00188220 [Lucifuga dentata]|nr:hypothetical protein LDENG_00188220 [Lucifuga dentata]